MTPQQRDRRIEGWERKAERGSVLPYLRTNEVRSTGNRARLPGVHPPYRIHHLMSHGEVCLFVREEQSPGIVALYEQYPLLPLGTTQSIADHLGIKHPRYPRTRTHTVMTTDLVTVDADGHWCARAVKPARLLHHPRTREKLVLEAAYWELQGVPWSVATDVDLRTLRNRSLMSLRRYALLPERLAPELGRFLDGLDERLRQSPLVPTADVVTDLAANSRLDYQDAIELLYHSIWRQYVECALDRTPLRLELMPGHLGLRVPRDARR